MNDLAHAPPSFADKHGRKVVLVDFTEARYRLEFDARAEKAAAFSELTFLCDAEGQTHHAGQTPLTVTSSHGRRQMVVAALRRISAFFQTLVRSAEQLSAEDRWRRILAEALKKYLRGRQPGRQPWLPPPRAALAG